MSFSLEVLGWSTSWADTFAPHAAGGLTPGRVARVDRGRCDVLTASGPVRAESARADVCTGDWVALSGHYVHAVLPRRTALVRAAASGVSSGQTLAANVDVVAVVVPATTGVDLGRAERLLALAWESGARPVVVLTKTDACPDVGGVLDALAGAAVGVDVLPVSAVAGEGLDALTAELTGTVVLVGQSGVGKSTLATALTGVDLAVQDVRGVDGKGRHTTVRRELIPLRGGRGVLIDTPGLRGVGLYDASDGLTLAFADVEALAGGCRFTDCGHASEPGCAVRAAIDAGQLPERRLESYRKLLRENEWAAARTDARLRAERRRSERVAHRQYRNQWNRPGHGRR
ncbi:ribosome small subunit-dependent GTPase A [Cryptosporangium phraense]|uniref:Small ribosomal subunit biogenesis GTPase RsgA n=1 Tax=Cryptosporangium phraense TaxID=2593070 RepID=A0A545AEG2_9ACTN|nr:ribosome small subunit-dependent GTPase A [Cryptosporangium phraense]TQS39726.1 ribosome small subunit-dependent GTPase A [Cryptosporangium phraense]